MQSLDPTFHIKIDVKLSSALVSAVVYYFGSRNSEQDTALGALGTSDLGKVTVACVAGDDLLHTCGASGLGYQFAGCHHYPEAMHCQSRDYFEGNQV